MSCKDLLHSAKLGRDLFSLRGIEVPRLPRSRTSQALYSTWYLSQTTNPSSRHGWPHANRLPSRLEDPIELPLSLREIPILTRNNYICRYNNMVGAARKTLETCPAGLKVPCDQTLVETAESGRRGGEENTRKSLQNMRNMTTYLPGLDQSPNFYLVSQPSQ